MDLDGKKVIVVGTGISGIGAIKLLCEAGAVPVLYDGNDKLDKQEIKSKFSEGAFKECRPCSYKSRCSDRQSGCSQI